jgi:hypothetical protein
MCPGSASIINNLDDLVDKWSQKISNVRKFADIDFSNTSRIDTKYNSVNDIKNVQAKALNTNKLKIKQPNKKKIKSRFWSC